MNAITKTTRGPSLTKRLKRIDPSEERPPDRELRRLRNLSADVGAACSAWLGSRGIKTRAWGEFNVSKSQLRRAGFQLQPESEP